MSIKWMDASQNLICHWYTVYALQALPKKPNQIAWSTLGWSKAEWSSTRTKINNLLLIRSWSAQVGQKKNPFSLGTYNALPARSDSILVECVFLASRMCARSGFSSSLLCTWSLNYCLLLNSGRWHTPHMHRFLRTKHSMTLLPLPPPRVRIFSSIFVVNVASFGYRDRLIF